MKTLTLGNTPLKVSRIALGCMGFGGAWDRSQPTDSASRARAVKALAAAVEEGINFFDHADIYCGGKSESVFADAMAELRLRRDQVLIQSKCGIRFGGDPEGAPHRFDFSYEHITASAEDILKRLRTDHLDVLLLHRPDALVEPEEVARAFDALEKSGKVRHFGVSNQLSRQMEMLRKFVRQPLAANQLQLSLVHTHLLDAGIVFNQSKNSYGCEGTIEYCRMHNITIQAWSPLGRGQTVASSGEGQNATRADLVKFVASLAEKKQVAPEAIAVAWLLRHPAKIQPVIGTRNPERIAAACQGDGVELTREEWYALFIAGRGAGMP